MWHCMAESQHASIAVGRTARWPKLTLPNRPVVLKEGRVSVRIDLSNSGRFGERRRLRRRWGDGILGIGHASDQTQQAETPSLSVLASWLVQDGRTASSAWPAQPVKRPCAQVSMASRCVRHLAVLPPAPCPNRLSSPTQPTQRAREYCERTTDDAFQALIGQSLAAAETGHLHVAIPVELISQLTAPNWWCAVHRHAVQTAVQPV